MDLTRQAERDKVSALMEDKRHAHAERSAAERVAALRVETDKLEQLLESNTELTRQDKELTERVAELIGQIHATVVGGK